MVLGVASVMKLSNQKSDVKFLPKIFANNFLKNSTLTFC